THPHVLKPGQLRSTALGTAPLSRSEDVCYADSQCLDRLLRLEEGLVQLHGTLERLWLVVKVLQGALDRAGPVTGAPMQLPLQQRINTRMLARVLAADATEREVVRDWLRMFYELQVKLQIERSRLGQLKQLPQPELPDLQEVRRQLHKLGGLFYRLSQRPALSAFLAPVLEAHGGTPVQAGPWTSIIRPIATKL
ncbi:MAG: hypothetical protein HY692_01900, partial [Cyanobacteria bacterium NC_groundwater_1444_Ag_S-0.65um_54_12]|nr:hypothetical protein [Cyanobacteria bacterium NC_groundwater_1444_Ag_S-0.65um_54_12]